MGGVELCPTQLGALTSDHAEVCLGLKSVQHLDNVLMPQLPQDLNLLPQVLDVLLAFAVLHDKLHGCDLACALPPAFVDL